MPASASRVVLVDADRDFARGVPDDELAVARQAIALPRLEIAPATGVPGVLLEGRSGIVGLLLLEGLIARQIQLSGRTATELLGPGDVLQPWSQDSEALPCTVRWTVKAPGALVVLDGRFLQACRRWPGLQVELMRRLTARADRLAGHVAALQLSRVELRVLAIMWQLADRWGHVGADGIVIPLSLTHQLLGEIAAARRPTVSLALRDLSQAGDLRRRPDGTWLLSALSRARLDGAGALV